MAIDNGIPLITDIKCAKLFVEALRTVGPHPQMSSQIDSISSHTLKRLPGFIDIHTHMREPGGEYKETWESGTSAALAGGITMVLAMPNTSPAVTDAESFAVVESVRDKYTSSSFSHHVVLSLSLFVTLVYFILH
ncbi:hypothetical protein AB6A40_008073 [Gnathostoma spinigerum]|uniref:Dihydroorotase catalytic domain-containing protein n=1 Tax=Gnathostoma spinigerum TaxID=75299 RepID=A0ABD6EVT0_9BILA